MTNASDGDLSRVWTTEKDNYVLVNTEFGYAIVNQGSRTMLCISDEQLHDEVVSNMLASGCRVYATIEEAFQ